ELLSSIARLRFLSHAHAATYNLRSSSKSQRTATREFLLCLTSGGHRISLVKTKIRGFWADIEDFSRPIFEFAV
ncbi:MAG TPA: hypothetical protein VFU50_16025, partial [Terriglobales bacterium]|nr:hypothetical protein [Terriglobales bacterium]